MNALFNSFGKQIAKWTQTFQMRNYARLAKYHIRISQLSAHNQYHVTIFRCSTYDTDVVTLNAVCQTFVG